MHESTLVPDHASLLAWYRENRRDLPWRRSQDPYPIWISEVMLQQTTVAAVVPFWERFLVRFPTVHDLAAAPEGEVLKQWAGLGYYSRARNLHRASKSLAAHGFPKTAAELIELPGFGPYTAAAVASIAFNDKAGVLDGNVIRVLCRRYGLDIPWWNTAEKRQLQNIANAFAVEGAPAEINQALMELGATVCTPANPACLLCPWSSTCVARATNRVSSLPRPKPRRSIELWTWEPSVRVKGGKVALIPNETGPVMKGQMIFPGQFRPLKKVPKKFDARHGITHHDIYILLKPIPLPRKGVQWVEIDQLESVNPSKMLQKALNAAQRKDDAS